jgi:hypothetical protein
MHDDSGGDWFGVVVASLERSISSRASTKPSGAVQYQLLFKDACARRGLFKLACLEEPARRLCSKAIDLLPKGGEFDTVHSDVVLECALTVIECFVEFADGAEVAASAEDIGSGCLDLLKSREPIHGRSDTSVLRQKSWTILRLLIRRTQTLSDVKKSAMSGVASKVGTAIAKAGTKMDEYQQRCLKECLMAYPSSLKGVSKVLWDITSKMESLDLFVLLPRISGSLESWSNCSQVLLASIHRVLDSLLDGLEYDRNSQERYLDPSIDVLDSAEDETFPEMFRRADRLYAGLSGLVSGSFSCGVPMPIRAIIELCRRCLVIDLTRIQLAERVGRTAGQVGTLGAGLSRVQINGMMLLRSMMSACGGHVVPYMGSIHSMLASSLEAVVALKTHGRDIADIDVVSELCRTVRKSLMVDGVAGSKVLARSVIELASLDMYTQSRDFRGSETLFFALLEVIETLYDRGVSALDHESRLYLDDFVLHIATSSYQLVNHKQIQTKGDCQAEIRLFEAAARTLEASVTAPSAYRPTHAAEAIRLFRKTLPFSERAIRRLEAYMHPKSLSLSIKIDNAEIHARNAHGMPSFWSCHAEPGASDKGARGASAENGGHPKAHEDIHETDATEKVTGKEETSGGDMRDRRTDAPAKRRVRAGTTDSPKRSPKRASVATRTHPGKGEDVSEKFKIVTSPGEAAAPSGTGKGEGPDDGLAAETRPVQNPSSDDDDFFDMIDSGEDD